jgi:hypothetical protein
MRSYRECDSVRMPSVTPTREQVPAFVLSLLALLLALLVVLALLVLSADALGDPNARAGASILCSVYLLC